MSLNLLQKKIGICSILGRIRNRPQIRIRYSGSGSGYFSPKIGEKKKLSKSVSGYYKTKKRGGMDH